MIRRFGSPPEPGRRYVRRIGAYALLPREDSLLLTLQSDPDIDLQLPGGGVDPGESPIAALHREVMEETGWRIANPRRVGAFKHYTYMPEYDLYAEKIHLVFVATPVLQFGLPTEQGHEALWMSPEVAAKALTSPGSCHFVKMALDQRGF